MDLRTGNGLDGLAGLPAGSVNLLFCDLPSGDTRADFDKPIDLEVFWRAAWEALAPYGNIVLMASSLRFAAEVIASDSDYRYDLIWHKTLATGFLNVDSRPLRAHEFVLVFFRDGGATYNEQRTTGHQARKGWKRTPGGHGENYGAADPTDYDGCDETRAPHSVLRFASVGTTAPERRHPQQKPVELLRWLVRTYSNKGDLVVDPCAGSGSMLEAAGLEGRRSIGWDLDPKLPRQPGLFG